MNNQQIRPWPMRLGALALAVVLAGCGGGESSSSDAAGSSQSSAPSETPTTTPPAKALSVEGYAIKGVIDGGVVSLRFREQGQVGWQPVGVPVRTDENGHFQISVAAEYAGQALRLSLSTDSQTVMRCDVAPQCKSPSGAMIPFGDWFWPGNDLQLETLVVPGSRVAPVALTPLSTLAYQQAVVSGPVTYAAFSQSLATVEQEWRLAPGALSDKPLDFAGIASSGVTSASLQAAALNTAFMALVDGRRYQTLGAVLAAARSAVTPNDYLPESGGNSGAINRDTLGLAALLLLENLEARWQPGSYRQAAAQAVNELEQTLVDREPQNPGQNQPAGTPDTGPETKPGLESKPEQTPETTPEQTPEGDQPVNPAPETDPLPNEDSGHTTPANESARLFWQAPLTRTNGESLAMGEIDHYLLRYGKEHTIENMSNEVRMADGQTMEYEISSLTEGTWYFAIRTVDVNGLESAWSNVVSKTVSR